MAQDHARATSPGQTALSAISAGTTLVSSGTVVFSNSNGVSFGVNGQTITATVITSGMGLSAGTQSVSTGTVIFSNSNNVSFGMAGSQTVTATASFNQTNQTVGLYASSNTYLTSSGTVDARSLSFRGDKSITVGISAGEVLFSVGPYITTAMASNRGSDFVQATAAFAGTNASGTIASGGISVSVNAGGAVVSNAILDVSTATGSGTNTSRFAADDHQHRGVRAVVPDTIASSFYGNVVMSAGSLVAISSGGASTAGSVIFHNLLSSATTVSQVASANAVGAMASRFALEGHQHAGVPAIAPGSNTGNTAGNTATQFGTWVLAGSDNVTISGSSGAAGVHTAWIKAAAGGAGGVIGTSIEAVASASSVGTVTRYAPEDHRHAGLNTISIIGNTSGTTTAGAGSIILAGGPNITLSASTAAGGMTVSVSGPTIVTHSTYDIPNSGGSTTSYGNMCTATSASVFFQPYVVSDYVSAGAVNLMFSVSFVTVGTSSGQGTFGMAFGLYTRPTNSNSSRIDSFWSNSVSWGVAGNNSTYTISQPTTTQYTGYGTGSTTSAGVNITSGYTGMKIIQLPVNTLLTPGVYWLGYMGTKSTSSNNLGLSFSLWGNLLGPTGGTAMAPMGSFSSAYSQGADPVGGRWYVGQGSWTSAGSVTMLPASAAFTSISAGDVRSVPMMRLWST